eukprot:PhF_6_TR36159/c0_g1_i1/m.52596/K17261/CAP1_2, SRV2; adenylyl cyclase-associated protein
MSYDDVLAAVNAMVPLADKIGGDCQKATAVLIDAFKAQSQFLQQFDAAGCAPTDPKVRELLQPTTELFQKAEDVASAAKKGPHNNHTMAVQEGIQVLSWVTVSPAPVPFLSETAGSMMFYGNKVLKDFKGKEQEHTDWVKAFQAATNALSAFVKAKYSTGLCKSGAPPPPAAADIPTGGSSGADWDSVVKAATEFQQASVDLGGDVVEAANLFVKTVNAQGAFITAASKRSKPADSEVAAMLTETTAAMGAVTDYCEGKKRSPQATHMQALLEVLPALGWVTLAKLPAPFVKETAEGMEFHGNKILKDKEPKGTAWVKALKGFCNILVAYIKDKHTACLTWGTGGAAPATTTAAPAAQPAPTTGGANALFAELNQGTDITKGLRKVSDSEKVYKQSAETRGEAVVRADALTKKKEGKGWMPPTGEPKLVLLGDKKWSIEYQTGTNDEPKVLNLETATMKHNVLLNRCAYVTLIVPAKVNCISLNESLRVSVIFEGTVGPLEITNCKNIEIRVSKGRCPSISVDKSEETTIQLNEDSLLETEIVTALSTATNIVVPDVKEPGETKELPVPEQFVSKLKGNKLTTAPTEHSSA